MRTLNRSLALFLGSTVFGGVLAAATSAGASSTWVRTVSGAACSLRSITGGAAPGGVIECPFPSDTITGATSIQGNAATAIYADYLLGEISTPLTQLSISACSAAYNASAGRCGTTVNPPLGQLGSYDVYVPLWTGTGSQWDYFYVTMMSNYPSGIILGGISAAGAN